MASTKDSAAKIAYATLIEVYAKKNPVKYAQKKVALEARLAAL